MLLVYYRLYITCTLAGFLFDLDQSNICRRDIQKIKSLVRQCIPIPQKIYNITKRLRTVDEVEQYFSGFIFFTDSTEQQIPRHVDKQRRDAYYSGKKKRHIIKKQIIVNNRGIIIHKTGLKKGRKHDYDIYKKNHPITSKQVVNVFDLGYLGVKTDLPEQLLSSLPNRKKKNMEYHNKRKRIQSTAY